MDNNGFNEYTPQNDPFTPAPPQTERPYYRARDFRAAARKALQGFWLMAIVVTFVAGLLGGITQGGISTSANVNYEIDSTELDSIPGADESALVDYIHWMESVNDRYPALKAFIAFASVLSGSAACCLLASALLSLGERRGRQLPGKGQRIVEVQLSLLMLVMIVFGEIAALRARDVSVSPMATMGMVALIFCVWIAGPKIPGRRRFETAEILKVIVLGSAATWLLAKFLSLTAGAVA